MSQEPENRSMGAESHMPLHGVSKDEEQLEEGVLGTFEAGGKEGKGGSERAGVKLLKYDY